MSEKSGGTPASAGLKSYSCLRGRTARRQKTQDVQIDAGVFGAGRNFVGMDRGGQGHVGGDDRPARRVRACRRSGQTRRAIPPAGSWLEGSCLALGIILDGSTTSQRVVGGHWGRNDEIDLVRSISRYIATHRAAGCPAGPVDAPPSHSDQRQASPEDGYYYIRPPQVAHGLGALPGGTDEVRFYSKQVNPICVQREVT